MIPPHDKALAGDGERCSQASKNNKFTVSHTHSRAPSTLPSHTQKDFIFFAGGGGEDNLTSII